MMDHQVLVSDRFMALYNFKNQRYRGEQYLIWWSGMTGLVAMGTDTITWFAVHLLSMRWPWLISK